MYCPLETVLADFEKFVLTKQDFQRLLNGIPLKSESLKENNLYVSVCDSQVVGIGEYKEGFFTLKTFLAE